MGNGSQTYHLPEQRDFRLIAHSHHPPPFFEEEGEIFYSYFVPRAMGGMSGSRWQRPRLNGEQSWPYTLRYVAGPADGSFSWPAVDGGHPVSSQSLTLGSPPHGLCGVGEEGGGGRKAAR